MTLSLNLQVLHGLLSSRFLGSAVAGNLLLWAPSALLALPIALAQPPMPLSADSSASDSDSTPEAIAPFLTQVRQQGNRISINGIALSVPWVQWQYSDGSRAFGLSDVAMRSLGGIALLNTDNPQNQPVAWRSSPFQLQPQRLELPALVTPQARYLALTPFQRRARWQVELEGDRLKIQTRSILQISNLLLGRALGNTFGPHDIQWSPGIRWQQRYVRQGGAEFPVTSLRLNLKAEPLAGQPVAQPAKTVALAPIWPESETLPGIAPIVETAGSAKVAAAINGGFFNRNNKTPLGAIRHQGQWISGPILNRGAMAWDDQGNVAMAQLKLEESLVVDPQNPQPAPFSVISLNSGYLKAGFSRYTEHWGDRYVPLTDNEVLIYIQNGKVIEQREAQLAGEGAFPIPQGNPLLTFLLVARSFRSGAAQLPVGTRLRLQQEVVPPALNDYPHTLGGGPLLLNRGDIVLDAAAEGFSQAFIDERAPRSVAASFADGKVSLLTVHERIGGRGPTLRELAQLLRSIGARDALNLDGGSSTQLLLGGQIINQRNPRNAARIHNGLGVFQMDGASR